jgi:hypothetical protein
LIPLSVQTQPLRHGTSKVGCPNFGQTCNHHEAARRWSREASVQEHTIPENGLLDVKRKTGKFLKLWVMLHYLSARLTMGSYHGY